MTNPAPAHILVVEDEQHLAVGIKFNLEAEGYRVTTVADGQSALKQFEADPDDFAMVILDIMLPGMSGYAVCETLREAGHSVPILMLSARTLAEDRARGFDVGANQYLTKPFDLDELLSRVKNLLRHASVVSSDTPETDQTPNGIVAFGRARVNFDTFEVFVEDEPIRMTSLELKLLKYFVQHEGRVIPRTELLEEVWNMPGHMNTRAPDQFIRRLRRTFEADSSKPKHFVTIRDAGYRFLATPEQDEDS